MYKIETRIYAHVKDMKNPLAVEIGISCEELNKNNQIIGIDKISMLNVQSESMVYEIIMERVVEEIYRTMLDDRGGAGFYVDIDLKIKVPETTSLGFITYSYNYNRKGIRSLR